MNNRTIKFLGKLHTLSPISITLPETNGPQRNTHGQHYVPASSIRGMLRSTASKAIAVLLDKHDKKLSIDEHYMNFNGADTGRNIKLGNGFERIAKNVEIRKTNTQISIFGNFGLAGRLSVGDAYLESSNSIIKHGVGSRSHPFNRDSSLKEFVKPEELSYLKDIMEADALTASETLGIKGEKKKLQDSLKKATGEEKKSIQEEINKIDSEIKDIKEQRVGSTESILRILGGYYAIDSGYDLSHRMILSNPSNEELDYFLWVLWKASANFVIGGHRNIGCGSISASWKIIETSLDDPAPKTIGHLTIDDDGFKLEGLLFDAKKVEDRIVNNEIDFSVY